MQTPQIIVITGLMAAGKSSVAQALAERMTKSIHLRGDIFRKMIVNGRHEMSPHSSSEAVAQLKLRYRQACNVAVAYARDGFDVVYQDVILGEHLLDVCAMLDRWNPGIVVLNPNLAVVAQRDLERYKTAYTGRWTPAALADALEETPRLGLWLDTSAMSVSETVDFILGHPVLTRQGLPAPE